MCDKFKFIAVGFFLLAKLGSSCLSIDVSSTELGTVRFDQIVVDALSAKHATTVNGRPAYISEIKEKPIYLYHVVTEEPTLGVGKWIISGSLGATDQAMAYINSWAIAPFLIEPVCDRTLYGQWMIPSVSHNDDEWEVDSSLTITCASQDNTVYLDCNTEFQPTLTGFYLERALPSKHAFNGSAVYSLVRPINTKLDRPALYLFKIYNTHTWIIGERIGVDAGAGYVIDNAVFAHGIRNREWNFVAPQKNSQWQVESAVIYSGVDNRASGSVFQNVYQTLRNVRSIKPSGKGFTTIRGNGIPMPLLGLGTGGLYLDELPQILAEAISMGYQLFDLAREYGNELLVGQVLRSLAAPDLRQNVFLETKVWPTELGVVPTTHAIEASIDALQTTCDSSVDWMHCETTVDVNATWRESWRALERAYAEGSVMSIGVSNFDVALLNELAAMATVLPHVVQNWADHSHLDLEVRQWCHEHEVVYQPYATLRNLHTLNRKHHDILSRIAKERKATVQAVSLQFFSQTGAAMIPRASTRSHLAANIRAVDWVLTGEEMRELGWTLPQYGELRDSRGGTGRKHVEL